MAARTVQEIPECGWIKASDGIIIEKGIPFPAGFIARTGMHAQETSLPCFNQEGVCAMYRYVRGGWI